MARDFNGTTQDLTGSPVLTAVPLTLACWFNVDDITRNHNVLSLVDDGTTAHDGFYIQAGGGQAGDPFRAGTSQDGTFRNSAAAAYSTGTWHHGAGVFASAASRLAYLDGTAGTEDTNSATPSGISRTLIGHFQQSGLEVFADGRVAEAAIWNVALTASEVAALAKGVSPLQIRPASLQAYWPLIGRQSPEPDWVGGFNLTLTNAPANAAHVPVMPPYAWVMNRGVFVPAAAGGAVGRGLTSSLRLDRPRLVA